jgi:hypothetical protein
MQFPFAYSSLVFLKFAAWCANGRFGTLHCKFFCPTRTTNLIVVHQSSSICHSVTKSL